MPTCDLPEKPRSRRLSINHLLNFLASRQRPAYRRFASSLEPLEPRVLLSQGFLAPTATAVITPSYVISASRSGKAAVTSTPIGLTPQQIDQAYGINEVDFGSVVGNGAGQTIAIVDAYNDPDITTDLTTFDNEFHLPSINLTVIGQNGSSQLPGTDPSGRGDSWAVEISLDVEWAHAVAPDAKIVLVEASSDSNSNLFAAVNTARNYAGVSVVSMSWGEDESASELSAYSSDLTTPAGHIGVTFLAATGDSGAYGSNGSTMTADFPAVSPTVLGVGGTTLNVTSNGTYISESGWGYGTSSARDGGSGGGISGFVAQPSYQQGVVTQSSTYRALPDVSMDADPDSGVAVVDSWDFGSSDPWVQVGGTSLATPLWAGVITLADQGRVLAGESTLNGATQTLPDLYSLPSSDFHDITTGNNGYAAGPGFDLVTGRGSPIVNLLVPGLVGTSVSQPPTTPVTSIASLTASPSSVTAGTSVTLTANDVTETSGTISSVAFYRESNGVSGLQTGSDTFLGDGGASGSNWSLSISTTGLAPGSYTYYAVATGAGNVVSSAASTSLTIVSPGPSNDNFANATVITGTTITVTGTNVGATKQPGEPNIAGNAGGKSVWYNWTATISGTVLLNTHGSNFDTLLGVFTGNSVSSLTVIASNDDDQANSTLTSAVTFHAVAGTTYHIAVDGYNGATGSIALNLTELTAPANDNFASAAILSGNQVTWTGNNAGATKQAGEPNIAGNAGGASVWFAWTATSNSTVNLNTLGSNFDTLLGVYTGSSVNKLSLVTSNDDDTAAHTLDSAVSFTATAGKTYYFAVDGYNGATGNIVLTLTAQIMQTRQFGFLG